MDPNWETIAADAAPVSQLYALSAGETFGPFTIVRSLGRGGMGEVYEAVEARTGRRLALKILAHRLFDADATHRFLREGRAAAAVSHPNSVYVFGSHEINGLPAIAMELVSGGTLQECVEAEGPMEPRRAITVALQLIDGLEAAARRGVLHRDVKPSNCFVGENDIVKVGDYGLSIPTGGDATRLTIAGTFLGTPAFASPEQIHGRELDVRSDIYSVGATLYYLLTARSPFQRDGAMQMLAAVLQDAPESPRAIVPAVPKDLAQVVLRCLQKDPAARYPTYALLREALAPLSYQSVESGSLGSRFVAGFIDVLLLVPIQLAFESAGEGATPIGTLGWLSASLSAMVAYFTVAEGRWGAGVGKRLLSLRVTDLEGNMPGTARAFRRAIVFTLFFSAPDLVEPVVTGLGDTAAVLLLGVWLTAFAVLLSTVRRANGWRAIHELASGTRTVRRRSISEPGVSVPTQSLCDAPIERQAGAARIGGYLVQQRVWTSAAEALDLASDEALQRAVWIHHVGADSPFPSDARQKLARPNRLRWLDSRRSEAENWDVYEAPEGSLLTRTTWQSVRTWLLDLSREMQQGVADGTLPRSCSAAQVWVGADGLVKLLDFPATAAPVEARYAVCELSDAQGLLYGVASIALAEEDLPALPRPAADVVRSLARRGFETFQGLTNALESAARSAVRVSPRVRASSMVLAALLPVLVLFIALMRIGPERAIRADPTLDRLDLLLSEFRRHDMRASPPSGLNAYNVGRAVRRILGSRGNPSVSPGRSADEIHAFAIHLADRYRTELADERTWAAFTAASPRRAEERRALAADAQRIAAAASDAERREAESRAAGILADIDDRARRRTRPWLQQFGEIVGSVCFALAVVGAISVLTTFLLRRPASFYAVGLELATREGPATRGRAAWRGVIAWTPVVAGSVLFLLWFSEGAPATRVTLALVPVMATTLGALWAIRRPRGIHDRLAGTWVVPS